MEPKVRKMAMVANKVSLHEYGQGLNDIEYWLSKTAKERLAEVTRLVNLTLEPGQRMDKTIVNKIRLHQKV